MASKIGSLEIDIKANIARLSQDMQAARSEVQKSTRGIQAHVAEMQKNIRENMEGVKKSFAVFKVLGEIGGITAVASKLLALGKSAAEYGDEIEHASRKTGISTDTLQGLKFAAAQSDVSFTQLQQGLFRLSRAMASVGQGNKQVAGAFQTVGLSASALKNMRLEDVLIHVSDAFAKSQDGAAKAAIAMQLFGRAGADLIPFLDQGSQNIDALTKKAHELGLVLSDQAIAKDAQFNESLKSLGAQLKMAAVGFGSDLTPAIQSMTDALSESLKPGGFLADTLKALADAIKTLVVGLELAWQSLEVITAAMAGAIVTVAGVINSALHLDWNGIQAAWDRGLTQTKLAVDQQVGSMMHTILAFKGELASVGESSGKKSQPLGQLSMPGVAGISHGSHGQMSEWRAELSQKQDLEGAYHEISKQDELAFWQAKLALAKKGSADYNAVLHEVVNLQRQVYKAQVAGAQKASEAELSLKLSQLNTDANLERNHLKTVTQNNQFLLQSGQITSDQKLARDQEVANQEYALALDLLSKKLELYQTDAKERAKIDDQIIKLNANREAQLTRATQTAVLDNQKAYQQMVAPITSAFDTSIKGIIMGTQTWQQAWQRGLTSILSSFIDTGIKMVSTWASQQLAMTLATTAQNEARMASNQMASASSLSTSALTIVKSIMNSASETFAGIFGFLAPVMGPTAAGPAAAGMGTVAAVAGSVASSAGGEWNIPMDRLQFVHRNETILPAGIAGGLRNLVERGGNAQSHQIHIHATDAQSVERLFHNNGAAIARALQSHLRNFGR
jgi:hypothetical protein